jgi:hypothetical protein
MAVARSNDHPVVDETAAVGTGDLHWSAAVEAGAELEPSPPGTCGGGPGHPLKFALPSRQVVHAAEADRSFRAGTQPEEAGAHGSVPTAPTPVVARCEVAGHGGSCHAATLALRPVRRHKRGLAPGCRLQGGVGDVGPCCAAEGCCVGQVADAAWDATAMNPVVQMVRVAEEVSAGAELGEKVGGGWPRQPQHGVVAAGDTANKLNRHLGTARWAIGPGDRVEPEGCWDAD